MARTEERDHVDKWLETSWLQDIPNLDLEVEGIVDRMNGLSRRFKRTLKETIAEQGMSYEEWEVLGALRRAGPPFRRSAGELAQISDLSSGAMTNRLDRLEITLRSRGQGEHRRASSFPPFVGEHYRPENFGGRFSWNARTASRWSSERSEAIS